MKKLFFKITLISILFFINLAHPLYAIQADVEDLSNNIYLSRALESISQAKESIYIVMYLISITPNQTETPVYQLINELINAHKKGVKVKVILDYRKGTSYLEGQTSYHTYKLLKNAGIDVNFDTPNIYSHNKVVIIDKEIIIMGSANWSNSALTENNETNILIKSPELAQRLLDQLLQIQLLTPYIESLDSTKIPYALLSPTGTIQEMLRRHDSLAFDMYLLLLYLSQTHQEITYEVLSKWFALHKRQDRISIRRSINRTLRNIDSRYNLVKFTPRFNKPFQLQLIDSKSSYFNLPNHYWTYEWHRRLELSQKVILLINLAELGRKPIWFEWQFSRKRIAKKYGISEWVISEGLKGLKAYNIIEIEYGDIKTDYEHRPPSIIRYLGLHNWNLLQEQLKTLKSIYGNHKYKKARLYASIIYKQNDPNKIEEIIKLIDTYREDNVDSAFKIISKKAPDNPKRSIRYVIGILKKSP